MSKHTPGVWFPFFDGEYWNVCLEGAEGFDREIVGCEGLYRCDGSDEANARLIAAAPELLEALEGFMACWDSCADPREWAERARAAIAKATGE